MSGILNTVGSKSGVIGQTELDYEEGTFTPKLNGVSGGAVGGFYTKIGNSVTITCYWDTDTNSLTDTHVPSGTHAYINNLPFISKDVTRYVCKTWCDWYVPSGTALTNMSGHMTNNVDKFWLYASTGNHVDGTDGSKRVTGSTIGTNSSGVRFKVNLSTVYLAHD